MTFDQSLISCHKDGVYAVAWMAGSGSQALSKYYKKHDIESISVPKTCEKLCLALQANPLNSQMSTTEEDAVIPFRVCTKLLFGTLKIYQQQVSSLLRHSEDLVIRSAKYDVQRIGSTTKRNKPGNHTIIKKRRLDIPDDSLNISNINYTEMLGDLERLAADSQDIECDEHSKPSTSKTTCHFRAAKLQIREITIREINATYNVPELDDDCGFGVASAEEIFQFFTHSSEYNDCENNVYCNKRTPKRKATYHDAIQKTPSQLDHVSPKGTPRETCTDMYTDEIATPPRFHNAYEEKGDLKISSQEILTDGYHTPIFERCASKRKSDYEDDIPEKRLRSIHETPKKLHSGFNPMDNDSILTPICNKNNSSVNTFNVLCDGNVSINETPIIKNEIKDEIDTDYEPIPTARDIKFDTSHPLKDTLMPKDGIKKSKLIIDPCTKIEKQEMIDQIHKQTKDLRGITIGNFKKMKAKKITSARDLLKRFNKRTLLFCTKLKQKQSAAMSHSKFQQEYLNLLRDILSPNFNEQMATFVYPEWHMDHATKKPKAMKKCVNKNDDVEQIENQQTVNENCNACTFNDIENIGWNNVISSGKNVPEKQEELHGNTENYITSNEWRPNGIMIKLLEIWRYSIETKIDANEFCHSAKLCIDKAIAFSSLLNILQTRCLNRE
ncbi:crossover suppressor on 2 of Manheim isoform X2 [Haematobia irritans]|uniref:crossover suppressor on 2 of Manheim isoform X2 n=1 Tax=Haematobia irritans TaxID=7368 RepID=UPI003F506362